MTQHHGQGSGAGRILFGGGRYFDYFCDMDNLKAWCRRYLSFTLLAALVVLAVVLFFNENSLVHTIDQEQRISELKAQIEDATDTLEYYRDINNSLRHDRETMERIVREQHHMQHPDEDVYIFR